MYQVNARSAADPLGWWGYTFPENGLTRAASEVELEKQHVDMYALTDRVNQLFFGILLLDEQLKQNSLLQEDLGRTHKQVATI